MPPGMSHPSLWGGWKWKAASRLQLQAASQPTSKEVDVTDTTAHVVPFQYESAEQRSFLIGDEPWSSPPTLRESLSTARPQCCCAA